MDVKNTNASSSNAEHERNKEDKINNYIQSLSEMERVAYEIAKSHLQTSFNLQKSNGFQQYLSSMVQKNTR